MVRYSEKVNKRFSDVANSFVSVIERIENMLELNPNREALENRIEYGLASFKRKNTTLASSKEAYLGSLPISYDALLSEIEIDITLQRYVYFNKIVDILNNYFVPSLQAIKVYREPDGRLVCWDGQHTLIVIYLIVTRILKMNPADVTIPIVISAGTEKTEMRRAMLNENGPGKSPFDDFDVYEQHVYGVRIDGATEDQWLVSERKQQYLENCGMFLANERMYNTDQPGALTRTQEICNTDFTPEVTKWFAEWCRALNEANRPFGGTEVDLMYNFFNTCIRDETFNLDLMYVMDVADVCKRITGKDFNGAEFWKKAQESNARFLKENATPESWYIRQDGEVNRTMLRSEKTNRMINYLCQVLESHGVAVPDYKYMWTVDPDEVF